MPIFPVPAAMQSSSRGFYPKEIEGSLRFNSGDAPYISFTNGTATNGKKCTLSFWIKKNEIIGSTTTARFIQAYSGVGNQFHSQWGDGAISPGDQWNISPGEQSSQQGMRMTDAALRDPSAWYHCVWKYNSESGSEESTLYVNGVQQSSSSYTTAPTTNLVTSLTKSGTEVKIGYINSSMPDFQLAELFILDGQSLGADSFGETKNGVWVPKNITASDFTMGTNGFHLNFQDDTEVEAFNTVLYRGDGSGQSVTGVGFSPDLVWIKNRTGTQWHSLFDPIRGAGQRLFSNDTSAEDFNAGAVQSWDSDGFTVGNNTSVNLSGGSFVAWCWDAGANNASTGHSSVTYSGNSGVQRISGFPFSPDLVWIKGRDVAENHYIVDTVRGAGRHIRSDQTTAQSSVDAGLTSFDKDGFVLGNTQQTNSSSYDYVAWGWDAGDSNPVSNTDGSTTSTVKASTTNGFSIVQYEGSGASATIGHGLSSAPDFIISKNIDSATSWACYHVSTGADIQLLLNSTNGTSADTNGFSDVPTSTVINVGSGAQMDTNQTGTHIAYCWHDVTGKQKFGTYTGNGSTTGPTVTTGFRPGFILIKQTDVARGWYIFDATRDSLGPLSTYLRADLTNTDGSLDTIQLSDTEFQLISDNASFNQSGGEYIYAAFAGSYSDFITDYNTDGTIDSRVKASDTTGFSIVSWEGDGTTNGTFGHGLSSAPDFIVAKDRDSNSVNNQWNIWHTGLSSANHNLYFTTGAEFNAATATSYGGIGDPSATTIKAVSGTTDSRTMNESGDRYIAYCWTETAGVSKFGSYTGNGTNNTITTGFKPSLVIIKRTDSTANWIIADTTRQLNGEISLKADTSDAESDQNGDDVGNVTDTGFDLGSNLRVNASGGTFVYAAFADTRDAAFWLDQSGNDNDWQPVNLDHNDTLLDSPTDNFCTLNPLELNYVTLSDGNLVVQESGGAWRSIRANFMMPTGQWYWEFEATASGSNYFGGGISRLSELLNNYVGESTNGYGILGFNGNKYNGGAFNFESNVTFTVGDVIGVAFDADVGTLDYYKNGTHLGTAFTGLTSGDFFPAFTVRSSTVKVNFGQLPFKYGPPA
jgi:hypothetical protein